MNEYSSVIGDQFGSYQRECNRALARQARLSNWSTVHVSFLQRQITEHIKELRKIARLSQAGNERAVLRKQHRVLRSFSARACGTLCALSRRRASKTPLAPITWLEFERLLQTSPLSGYHPDPCRVFSIKKQNGEKRIITAPGTKTISAQIPLTMVLHARGVRSPFEYNRKGKGQLAALSEVKRLMIEEELRWFVVFDLAKYFTSVRPKHLKGFKLPKEVKQNVAFYNRYAMLIRRFNGKSHWSIGGKCDPARRGIPQGAPASGIIASALLGRELRNLSGELGKVTYVDDGVIGVRTQLEASKVAQALKTRFANLTGGPIHFKHITVRDARDGLEFLGYWVRMIENDGEIQVRFTPSHQAKNRFRRKLHERLRQMGHNPTMEQAYEKLSSYRQNWLAQKSLWEPSAQEQLDFEIESECWVDDFFNGFTKKLPLPGSAAP